MLVMASKHFVHRERELDEGLLSKLLISASTSSDSVNRSVASACNIARSGTLSAHNAALTTVDA
jgi:hypothetical protein